MSFSVIICAYADKRWDDLCAAIDSLGGQTQPPAEIVIIIDHNPALLARVCQRYPQVKGAENAGERGLSGARNTGIALAKGDVIAFMDDDAIAAADWLETLARSFTGPDVMGVGGSVIPAWDGGRPRWFPDEFDWVVGCTYRGMPERTSPIRNLIGCNMALRRDVFSRVGGFAEHMGRIGTLPVGCEETELCIRTRQQYPGAQLIFDPAAAVRHHVTASRRTWAYFSRRCFSEGISKVHVAQLVGASDGLASERTYAMRTLPLGVLRGLADALLRFDLAGLGRAGAIVAGLAMTTAGYASALVSKRARAVGSQRS